MNPPDVRSEPDPTPPSPPARTQRWVIPVLALVAILLAASVVYLLNRGEEEAAAPESPVVPEASPSPVQGLACPTLREAAAAFEAGDEEGYREAIREAARVAEATFQTSGQASGQAEVAALRLYYDYAGRPPTSPPAEATLQRGLAACDALGQ